MHPIYNAYISVPALEVIAISESRGGLIYEGTMFSLTCLITPNMTGVNTDITIQRTFSGPGTSAADRVTTENDAFQTTLMFRPVAMTDDGRYVCSASAISTPQYPSVEASNETENRTIMAISRKPYLLRYRMRVIALDPHTHKFPYSIASPRGDYHCSTHTNWWSELHSRLLCQDRRLCHQCSYCGVGQY